MSPEKTNALIDHLDESFAADPDQGSQEPNQGSQELNQGSLEPIQGSREAYVEMQRLIAEDENTAREWLYLQLAVDAVQDAGLREKVTAVRQQWEAQAPATQEETTMTAQKEQPPATMERPPATMEQPPATIPASGTVRHLYRNMMRVAACAVLIAGGACIFKYVRLSSSSLYSEYYTAYEINTSRGAVMQDPMEQAYAGKNWTAVLSLFSTGKDRNNKTDFLAGIADMELKKFDDAIAHFEQVIASNSHSGGDYFEDEAEYYLAISWLAKNKVNEAMPILEKIRANKDHLYHEKVEKMSFTDLRLVQYKENK